MDMLLGADHADPLEVRNNLLGCSLRGTRRRPCRSLGRYTCCRSIRRQDAPEIGPRCDWPGPATAAHLPSLGYIRQIIEEALASHPPQGS
jgi:hypothetical protein